MGLKADLESEVAKVFRSEWEERDGAVVPDDDSVGLGNEAVKLNATVLYADLADSTNLVRSESESSAAELYKTFLHCAAKIIRSEGGEITAYDGDRVMAVYIGGSKNTRAVRSAMKINYAVSHIVNPAHKDVYTSSTYTLRHVAGVDTSNLFVAKTGVRGANDLVWVGRAANYAAKLAALPHSYQTYITKDVYESMNEKMRVSADGQEKWEAVRWDTFDNSTIYRSTWWWSIS